MTSEVGTGTGAQGFEDRSARLFLFGFVAVGVGGVCIGLGLLQVAMVFLGSHLPDTDSLPSDARAFLMGAAVYALIGLAFIWLGVGSARKRRWVRPLMLTLAWTWLLGGVLSSLFAPRMMDSLVLTVPNPETAGLFEGVKLFVLILLAGFGILLPALFIWVYRDPHLQRTCEAHDPGTAWTERCPTPVLGLSVGLGACAVLALPMLARPALPFFTVILTGRAAAGALLFGALACAYLARSTYRLEMAGWWGTVAFLTLLGLATGVAFAVLDPSALYRALGYPEPQVEALAGAGAAGAALPVAIAVVFTVASLVYMVRIRKYFTSGEPGRD